MPSFFAKVGSTLTKTLGPLPVWGWGVVAGGSAIVVRQFATTSRKGTATSPTTIGESSVIPSLSGGGAAPPFGETFDPSAGILPQIFVSTPFFTVEGPAGQIGSIIDQILADSRTDPGTGGGAVVDPNIGAVEQFLSDAQQQIEDFFSGVSTPDIVTDPGPVPDPAPAPTPTAPPTPKDPCLDQSNWTKYTVKPGDTMTRIGNSFGIRWQCIWAIDPGRSGNPDLIFPGETFTIPPPECCK